MTALPRFVPGLVLLAAAALLCAPSATAKPAERLAPKGFFGVHPRSLAHAEPSDYERMGEAHVGVIRTGFIFGRAKDHKNEPFDWTEFDSVVRGAASNGIDVLPVLLGVPPYVSTKPGTNPLGNSESDWRDYLTSLVERYGPNGEFWDLNPTVPVRPITDWQIWNEENALTNWELDPNPRQYGRLLAISADAIHSVDPSARIITGGVISTPQNPEAIPGATFLRRMLESRAARQAVDIVAIHPYASYVKDIKPQMRLTRETLDAAGVDAPIWITEVGWGSGTSARNHLLVTEEKQAENLEKAFQLALRERVPLGIGRMIWYQWRDGPDNVCKWCPTAGLLQQDGVAKPLLDIFSGIARI